MEDKHKERLTQCPTDSEWFARFNLGCKKRMGQDICPQLGLSIEVMLEYMKRLDRMWLQAMDEKEINLICSVGAYSVITYASSLRGNAWFLLNLFGRRTHIAKCKHDPTHPHMVATLLGRLKGKDPIGPRSAKMVGNIGDLARRARQISLTSI
jgi:hypothetical protein